MDSLVFPPPKLVIKSDIFAHSSCSSNGLNMVLEFFDWSSAEPGDWDMTGGSYTVRSLRKVFGLSARLLLTDPLSKPIFETRAFI